MGIKVTARWNFRINQGATKNIPITWKDKNGVPIDLTGYVIRSQIRPAISSSTIFLEMNSATPAAGVSFGPLNATGVINITLSANLTASLSFNTAYYDLEAVSSGGQVTRVLEGLVVLSPEVTR